MLYAFVQSFVCVCFVCLRVSAILPLCAPARFCPTLYIQLYKSRYWLRLPVSGIQICTLIIQCGPKKTEEGFLCYNLLCFSVQLAKVIRLSDYNRPCRNSQRAALTPRIRFVHASHESCRPTSSAS